MKYCYLLYLVLCFVSFCISISPGSESASNNLHSVATKYIDFTGQYNNFCLTNLRDGEELKTFELVLYAEISGFTQSETFILNLSETPYAYMTCTIPSSPIVVSNVTCTLDAKQYYIYTLYLPEEFPQISDCQVSYWDKVPKQITTNCQPNFNIEFIMDEFSETIFYSNNGIIQGKGHVKNNPKNNTYSFDINVFIDNSIRGKMHCFFSLIQKFNWSFKCSVSGKKSILIYPTISHDKLTNEDFYLNVNKNIAIINYQFQASSIEFDTKIKTTCSDGYFKVIFHGTCYDIPFLHFYMDLASPNYAHLRCHSGTLYSGILDLTCELDIHHFPQYSDLYLRLPDDLPISVYSNWYKVQKDIGYVSCHPNLTEIQPYLVKGPECAMDNYNTFLAFVPNDFEFIESNFSFDLYVFLNSSNKYLPCEFYQKKLINNSYYSLYYCYLEGNGYISFFRTYFYTKDNKQFMIKYQNLSKISFSRCLFTNKTIYFNFALQKCSRTIPNKVYLNINLYAKMSKFSSDYSFKINLVNSTNAYLDCSVPLVSGFQTFTNIECILDRLKFPLLDEETITLPENLSLQDIDILNWENIDKKYNISSCAPEYDFIFSPEEYKNPYCYKAYNNLFSINGQISRVNSNDTKNLSDFYNFEIEGIVDDKFSKFSCELINLNISNLNKYQLNCIVNGNISAEIFDTIIGGNEPEYTNLIYINTSHYYSLEKCDPTKFISFKNISTNCSFAQNIFNIYLYADMNGFLTEEKIKVYFEKPSYIYMECTLPKTEEISSEQHIHCIIDTKIFPLIDLETITLPNEFIVDLEHGIFNWEKIDKNISTGKCPSNYNMLFNPVNFFDTECYSNGLKSFIVDGNLITNNSVNTNNMNINKFNLNAIIDSQHGNISCEIFPPDSSNIYSRIYCYSNVNNYVEIFPTVTKYENSEENIYINISHIYYNKICPTSNKMIFFKRIESECLSNNSTLKLLIHSEISGFSSEETLVMYLEEPKYYFIECTIPKSKEHSFIQCEMDVSKFPLIKYEKIIMSNTFPIISNYDIMNWNNINKVVSSGKCYKNYLLTFSSSVIIQPECYDKNYNSFIIRGNLDKNESFISNINQTYTFSLFSFCNGYYYDNILCDIYHPDSTSYEFRMFCYTDKDVRIELFQTIAIDDNTKENIYINISNYQFDLLDCRSYDKIIYFKSININYEQKPLLNIDIKASISGIPQEELFKIFLKEPDYSYMVCNLPSSENNSKDIKIECNFDTQKFPLIENKTMILPMYFPQVQEYSIANSDFNNKELFINYYNPPYSIKFVADKYIDAKCFKIGVNVFSVFGKIIINDTDNINSNIYTFNNFMIIDGSYSFVSCKIYPISIYGDIEHQMDCYTNGTLNASLFRTISVEQQNQKNIYIDINHTYLLKHCSEPVKKSIDFIGISSPNCKKEELSNDLYLNLNITAKILGFIEDESISFYLEKPSYFNMNCIIPFSRNGETIFNIICKLNALFFPIISFDKIVLPKEFPKMEGVEISGWDKMKLDIDNIEKCHKEYQLIFSDIKYNGENCKSKNENIISLLGSLTDKNKYPYLQKDIYSFTLRSIINNEPKNISCELYPSDRNKDYYQMDCNIIVNNNLEFFLYEMIAYNEFHDKYIYIIINNSYHISECSKKNKFINFDGNTDTKFNKEKSLFELDIYAEIIGFEEEKEIKFNLDYPKYSKMDCTIPSSNASNINSCIICSMDMNKYPLIEGDNIILPYNIFDKENCSQTKWDKVQKKIDITYSFVDYSILFSSSEKQDITSCDDKGNNIMIISGLAQTSKNDKIYNFNISGIVDDILKNISCNLNITGGKSNEIKCLVNGKTSSQIFQTKGVDNEKNETVLIKINNYLDYNLKYCPVSKTNLILAIVLPIGGAFIIIVVVLLVLKYKKKHSFNPIIKKKEIEQIGNMNLIN